MTNTRTDSNPLADVVVGCRRAIAPLVLFSMGVNFLMLTTSLYMLQVYDRVLSSRSLETLAALSLIAILALATMAALEVVRGRLLLGVSGWISHRLSAPLLTAAVDRAAARPSEPARQPLQDLEQLRNFLTGPGVFPILDAPWAPIFLGVIFLLHPWLGWMSLIGCVLLFLLALLNEAITQAPLKRADRAQNRMRAKAAAATRNAEAVQAMGMLGSLLQHWQGQRSEMVAEQARASVRAGLVGAAAKFMRQALQLGILGLGAYLAVREEITPGTMIAASILMGRALAPVEQAIGAWRGVVAARGAFARLRAISEHMPAFANPLRLPPPRGRVAVDHVSLRLAGAHELILKDVSFVLEPGEALGLIGPSGAGKTSLARAMVGAWTPTAGRVTLDEMDVARWLPEDRGVYIGYLPQDVELFAGSVKDNIARFRDFSADPAVEAGVLRAAELAGVDALVKSLPDGYETEIGEGGAVLSGGQRQRIALARALFGAPALVVLDEPNASLDRDGEEALFSALAELKATGRTVVIIAHRPRVLQHVDRILVLRQGEVELLGPRDAVLARLTGVVGGEADTGAQIAPLKG